jgi:hypothetical protein
MQEEEEDIDALPTVITNNCKDEIRSRNSKTG